jgi:hypothetical protein
MINHLEQLGHTVKVVSYDRGYRNLKNDFDVFETEGLHIASSDNRVSKVKTFTENLQRLPRGHKKLHALRKNVFKQFRPNCVITGFESFLKLLRSFSREQFIVYGYDRDDQDGSIVYKRFSKDGFLEDLASCKAVMATAGFTLMTESFYFRKPYLALPMHGQFEQELNAFWMAKLNYGINLRRIRSEAVGNFLYRLPDFEEKLNEYHAADNSAIKAKLGELLINDCALVKAYHLRRKK